MSDLGTLMATLGADLGPLNRSVGVAEGLFRRYEQSGTSAFSKIKNSIFSLQGAVISLAASMGLMKMKDYIVNVTHMAGRYDTLGISMYAAGKNAGYTIEQMDALEKSLEKLGIADNEARESLSRMAAAHIDLAKAAELGRAAQDVAVVGGINSSEAFERLTYAITSAQVEMLRTIGLNVTFEEGYKKTAASLGKTVEALTEEEKIQSRVNTVLKAAANYQGIYAKSMESPEKLWGSLVRYIEKYELAFGRAFQPAFLAIMKAKIALYEKLAQVLSDPRIQKSLQDIAMKFAEMYAGFMSKIPQLVENLSVFVSAFSTLAKIVVVGVAVRAAFVGLTTVLYAGIVAVQTFQLQMGLLRLELIAATGTAKTSQMVWTALNTPLWGVGIAAQWASGWIAKLKISVSLLYAAFVGWEIGKLLTDNFESARIAGVWLVNSLIKGWLNVEYAAEKVFLWLQKAWTTVIDTLKSMYGTFLEYIASGLSKINMTETAASLNELAKEYKGPKVEDNGQYEKDLADIETKFKERMAKHAGIIGEMRKEAINPPGNTAGAATPDWIKKLFEGVPTGGGAGAGDAAGAMSDKLKSALKSINEEIIRSKENLIGITQGSYAQTLLNIEDEAKKYEELGVGKTKIDEYVSARKMEVQAQASKQIEDDIRSSEVNILGYKEGTYAKEMAMLADKAEEYRKEGATEEEIARYVASRKEEISLSSTKEKLEAERNLYEDLRGYSGEYFEVTKQLIDEQARQWKALGISEVAIMAWVKEENTKAFIEMGKKSQEFGDGVAAAIEEIKRNMMTMGQAGYEIVNEFSTQASSTLSSLFFDVAKDEFKGFASYFDSFADAMLKKWIDICSQMLVEWILTQMQMKAATGGSGIIGSIFGAVLGAFTGGSSGTVSQLGTPGPGQAIAHMGGKIGYTGFSTRPVNPAVFNGAMRLHNGLRPDEYPFIGQRGETILKKGESLSNGPQVEINVVNQNGSDVSTKDESTFDIVKVKVLIKDAVSEDIMTGGKIHNSFRKKFGISPSIIGR